MHNKHSNRTIGSQTNPLLWGWLVTSVCCLPMATATDEEWYYLKMPSICTLDAHVLVNHPCLSGALDIGQPCSGRIKLVAET